MRKLSTYYWAVPIMLFLSIFSAKADTYVTIGGEGSNVYFPFRSNYEKARSTILIKAEELGDNYQLFEKISFNFRQGYGVTYNSFSIKMQNTNIEEITNTDVFDGWIDVYFPKALTTLVGSGWFEIPFDNKFRWDGSSNILIQFCYDNNDYIWDHELLAGHSLPGHSYYSQSATTYLCNPDKKATQTTQSKNLRPQIRLHSGPAIANVTPAKDVILKKGSVYADPDENHPGFQLLATPTNKEKSATYLIAGPGEKDDLGYEVIYEALDPNNLQSTNIDVKNLPNQQRYVVRKARGIAANPETGDLDLLTNAERIQGGEYTVITSLSIPKQLESPIITKSKFSIALQKDIGISKIDFPKLGEVFELDRGRTANSVIVRNYGLDSISHFRVYSKVSYLDTEDDSWSVTQRDTVYWNSFDNNNQPLKFKEKATIRFANPITFNKVGRYKVEYEVELGKNEGIDLDLKNNLAPRTINDVHYFDVAYSVEVYASKMVEPKAGQDYFKSKPVPIVYEVGNNGFSDTAGVAAELKIYWVNPNNNNHQLITTLNAVSDDLVRRGLSKIRFNDFYPPKAGTYVFKFKVSDANDPVPSNNTLSDEVVVLGPLAGVYTVGLANEGHYRNFNTIEEFANAVMKTGIDDVVTASLTDEEYNIGENAPYTNPAIDFSSHIVGASKKNYIKFVPSEDRLYTKAGVKINIKSESGIGFKFGQNDSPSNSNAVVHSASKDNKKKFANPSCAFVFDGGPYKALQFNMNTRNKKKRMALYFGPGSSNNVVKNCIFKDNSPVASYEALIPLSYFDYGSSMYMFDNDSTATGTYSTAIVSRSFRPIDSKNDNYLNTLGLDTLVNQNNIFENNEISNFSYGIMLMGVGPLFDQGPGDLKAFMNTNNKIINNEIYDVKRAGIFVGFEDSCLIQNNVIYEVSGISSENSAAGIIAGGEARGSSGYYNTNLTIDGNEIYRVYGTGKAYGILVEGPVNKYSNGYAIIVMPRENENIKIINNTVREIKPRSEDTYLFGINVQSGRKVRPNHSKLDNFITSEDAHFRVRDVLVANNTVVLKNDRFKNTGVLTNVALMNVKNTKIVNNALAILDRNIDTRKTDIAALITMAGYFPMATEYISDRNAFEVAPGSPASVYRFIETDSNNRIVEKGYLREYQTLQQWQNWTAQDINSLFGNFTDDLTENRVRSYYALRVRTNPLPKGSILNNNAEILTDLFDHDIDGNKRGSGNTRYDIGASEFAGIRFSEDLSIENIIEPRSYQSGKDDFSDAEYIMQNPPFNVKAIVRNNGSLKRSNITVRTLLYLEAANGKLMPIDSVDKVVTIPSEEEVTIHCTFPSEGDTLFPHTFTEFKSMAIRKYTSSLDSAIAMELFNYNVPAKFQEMANNITPRYKIRVQLAKSDQKISNDYFEKYVRYYIPKTKTGFAVTAENIGANLTDERNADIIAGKLNFNTVVTALEELGYSRDMNDPKNFDVFDRSAWEPRAVDYSVFNTLFWADGDDKALTKNQIANIRDFLSSYGAHNAKRNLIIASQEMARKVTDPTNYQYDVLFANEVLRAIPTDKKTPIVDANGAFQSYDGHKVVGTGIKIEGANGDHEEEIKQTKLQYDVAPFPGELIPMTAAGDAVSFEAFKYLTGGKSMGVASYTLMYNTLYLGVDWRHFSNPTFILKAIMDYIKKNGGDEMVPVELADFDAIKVNNQVQLAWKTIYELNSNRFEVEKATENESGRTEFSVIETVKAGNNSAVAKEYGPIIDRNVALGNKYIYRLKVIDNDGSYSYSNEVAVEFGNGELSIINVRPNPVQTNATITFNIAGRNRVDVSLFDINGRKVQTLFNQVAEPGNNSAVIDATGLASGTYSIVITDGNSTITKQIVIKK